MQKIIACGLLIVAITFIPESAKSQDTNLYAETDKMVAEIEDKVIEWRRDIHQYPELSNREFRTAEKVATHLASLGIEVQTKVAHTGVVGVPKGRSTRTRCCSKS